MKVYVFEKIRFVNSKFSLCLSRVSRFQQDLKRFLNYSPFQISSQFLHSSCTKACSLSKPVSIHRLPPGSPLPSVLSSTTYLKTSSSYTNKVALHFKSHYIGQNFTLSKDITHKNLLLTDYPSPINNFSELSMSTFDNYCKSAAANYGHSHLLTSSTYTKRHNFSICYQYPLLSNKKNFCSTSHSKSTNQQHSKPSHTLNDNSIRSQSHLIHFDPLMAENVLQSQLKLEKRQMNRVFFSALLTVLLLYFISQFEDVQFWAYDVLTELFVKYMNDCEKAHHIVIFFAKYGLLPHDLDRDDPSLRINVSGLDFPNPIGLAAGFDKNAEGALSFMKMGFGFVEVGTLTPRPQAGNPLPRLFRLNEDRALINRYGFNNVGADEAEKNLQYISEDRWKNSMTAWNILGVNIGKNKDTVDMLCDLETCINKVGRYADYLVINVSSPNTPGLRDMQNKEDLTRLIRGAQACIQKLLHTHTSNYTQAHENGFDHDIQKDNKALPIHTSNLSSIPQNPDQHTDIHTDDHTNNKTLHDGFLERSVTTMYDHPHFAIKHNTQTTHSKATYSKKITFPNQKRQPPLLFVKISPDLDDNQLEDIADVALKTGIDGLIVTNTTVSRPALKSSFAEQAGGLSGHPLKEISTEIVGKMFKYTHAKIPIIAVGGVENGQDALDKIEAGASLVQVYSSLIFGGPAIARRIKNELAYLLYKKGYHTVKSAVGNRWVKPVVKRVKAPSFE